MSPQKRRSAHARGASGLALVALLWGTLVGLSDSKPAPVPASMACSGSIVTNVKLNQGRSDFGADPHLLGGPTKHGRICWAVGGAGGAIVEGQLYYDDLFNRGCAHINVEFFNASGTRVSVLSNGVCSPGGLRQKSIFSQISSGNPIRIVITLSTSETSTGPKTNTGPPRTYAI